MSEQYRPPTRRALLFGALAALGGGAALASERQGSELSPLEKDASLVQKYASTADMHGRRFPDIVSAARPHIAESKSALEKARWWADVLRHRKHHNASHSAIRDAQNWIVAYRHMAREALNRVPDAFHTLAQLQRAPTKKPEKRRKTRRRRNR